jgi:hypothetical protein
MAIWSSTRCIRTSGVGGAASAAVPNATTTNMQAVVKYRAAIFKLLEARLHPNEEWGCFNR